MELLGEASNRLVGARGLSYDLDKRSMYGGASRRTYQPVRKQSRLRGREGTFWRGISRIEARQIVFAARRYELATKQAGKRTGALGGVAIEILDYFANLVDFKTGQLDPAITTLMDKLCRSRDAIVRGLKALRTHGFIDWLRRYIPADDPSGQIQVQQTSNAYRLSMPKRALKLLGRYGQKAPIPDDEQHRQDEQAAMIEEHRSQLSMSELPLFDMGSDNPLAQSLARLGAALDRKKRESVERTESLSKSIINRKKDTPRA